MGSRGEVQPAPPGGRGRQGGGWVEDLASLRLVSEAQSSAGLKALPKGKRGGWHLRDRVCRGQGLRLSGSCVGGLAFDEWI